MATHLGSIGARDVRQPPIRSYAVACQDPADFARGILNGGRQSHLSVNLGDSWIYDIDNLNGWTQAAPTSDAPPARFMATMALNLNGTPKAIRYGGTTGDGRGETGTYAWDGFDWTHLTPSNSPSALYGHCSAFVLAASGDGILVFGGVTDSGVFSNATWFYDDGTQDWTQFHGESPDALVNASLTYDPNSRMTFMFGGRAGAGAVQRTAWVIGRGSDDWSRADDGSGPNARYQHATSAFGDGIIMFGGDDGTGAVNDEMWEIKVAEPSIFTQLFPDNMPPARRGHAMYTDSNSRLILIGGNDGTHELNDIWMWDGTNWTRKY